MTGLIYEVNLFGIVGIILSILLIAISIMIYKFLEGLHWCLFKRSRSKLNNELFFRSHKIHDHSIFKRFDNILNNKIPKLREGCPSRKLIFLQLLEIKIQNIKDNFEELMHVDINAVSADVFKIHILALLNNTTMMFYKKTFDNEIQDAIVNKFEKKLYPAKELIETLICGICDADDWYSTNLEKLFNILDLISAYEACVVAEVERVVSESYSSITSAIYEGTASNVCALDGDFKNSISPPPQKTPVEENKNDKLSKTILYVEDNIGSATIMTKGLAKFNVYVIIAKSVMDALELLDKITVDAAIIDYGLPDMPGTCLEESLLYYKVPFMYYTAINASEIKTKAKILSKPYNLADLNNELSALITESRKKVILPKCVSVLTEESINKNNRSD